jgi:hypothetical protein
MADEVDATSFDRAVTEWSWDVDVVDGERA